MHSSTGSASQPSSWDVGEWEQSQLNKVRRAREEFLKRESDAKRQKESSRIEKEKLKLSSRLPAAPENIPEPATVAPTPEDLELQQEVETEVAQEMEEARTAQQNKVQQIEILAEAEVYISS